MKQQAIFYKIRDIISPYLDEPCDIKMETHLIQDLAINSFDYTNIITDIEDTFRIRIDDLTMYYIKDLVRFIIQHDQKEGVE
jgi:acyl carrier protein